MGKLLQPLNCLKVECSVISKPDLEKEDAAEYLEAYCDTYGEGPTSSDSLHNGSVSFAQRLSPHRATSAGFARVLRRQSSISMRNLASFGEDITPRDGNKKNLDEN
jgi:hypothetical protein